jgi:ubiquinone/menaquinone biosynthesis C-methylase UbiE
LIARILADEGMKLEEAWIVDLGAGDGKDLATFRELGARGDRLVALDVLPEVAGIARRHHPWMSCVAADSASLPLRDGHFDLVYQSTMISSVLSHERRAQILAEVLRVMAPGGFFLSYDTRYPNPWNRNTRPLRVRELRQAFAGWRMKVWTLTALPPLVRLLAPVSLAACRALEALPVLRSNMLALVRKP